MSAIHMPISRFEHIPVKTVRFWAWLDTAVTWMLSVPPLAPHFIGSLYWLNGQFGGVATAPPFEAMHIVFVSLTGSLVSVWCIARLLYSAGWMAAVDGWGRLWVGATLVWIILAMDGPPVLWCFVFTEWIGAQAQLRAAYFPKSAPGSISIASP